MDKLLARRIESDKDYRARIVKKTKDYLKLGRDQLAYWSNDFDVAYDTIMCYAPLGKKDMELLERGHPKRFVWPMTATQIDTMTTYISQVLFGQETPWKVEGRGPEDEIPAEFVNQLLRWNAEQQQTYNLGYLWVRDCLATNRGIFYNSWSPIFKPEIIFENVVDEADIDPETQQPRSYQRPRRKQKVVGGYNRIELVSPYDFVCDTTLPLWRLQEMRFCGHRTVISVTELRQRAKLPPDHPKYVLPSSVAELVEKAKKGVAQVDAGVPSLPGVLPTPSEVRMSRSAYERTRALQPTGQQQADKADTGDVECWELWVRLVPSENGIYEDEPLDSTQANIDDEPTIFQILIAGGDVLLAINESTYLHGMYPYSIGEGRPNAHFQFSPSWVMMLKGIQDYVDWLKNRHQEALSRTIGNIFVVDPSMVDTTDFMNPDKEGLLITLKPEAYGRKIDEIIKQVPIKDMTEGFHEEAMQFMQYAETVTAANSAMQGSMNSPGADPSATQFSGTMQMGAGRLTSIARLLSSQALVPQAQQFVSNFQQFMDQPQQVRFKNTQALDLPPELQAAGSLTLNKDVIQGEYDFVAHDGTLPGTDARKVAAGSRVLEAAAMFPQIFTPAPGNFDPRRIIYDIAKAAGLRVENLAYSSDQFQAPPDAGAPPGGPALDVPPDVAPPGAPPLSPGALPPVNMPAAPAVVPPGATPGPKPAMPDLASILPPMLPKVGPKQPRPANQ